MSQPTTRMVWIASLVGLAVGLAAGLGVWALQRDAWSDDLQAAKQATLTAEDDLASLESSLGARIADLEAQLASATADSDEEPGSTVDPDQSPPTGSTPPEMLERSVDPETADPGDPLTFRVRVSGDADSVALRIAARSGGYDESFDLALVPGAGDVHLWEATIDAPSDPGEYRYYATATLGDVSVEMPGVSGWTFFVR